MRTDRASYRNSPGYAGPSGQVRRNSSYYNRQRAANPGSYDGAGRQLSPARQSYIGGQKTSGAFKSSNTGVRSGFGKFGGRSGGASGGGGAQKIISQGRW